VDSTFIAACQGAGLALAAGILAAAPGRPGMLGSVLEFAGAIAGALLFGISLHDNSHTAWPGYLAGAALALFAFMVAREVVAGAASRPGSSAVAVGGLVAVAALVLAGVTLLVEPLAIAALVAIVGLGLARRRRAGRKYEGLRVLR
jgi:hypothetical protein